MTEVHGTCDERFTAMRDLLAANLASGADLGASVAVTLDGEPVVDLWGGWSDAERDRPVDAGHDHERLVDHQDDDGARALVLVERGLLDVYAPVAEYWPEFAANGKDDDRGPPPDVAHVGRVGVGPAGRVRRHLRLGEVDVDARRPGAVVGAGHGIRLPRAEPGPPRRRGRAAHHRAVARPVLRRGDRRSARRRLPHRARRRSTTTASRTSSRRRRCRSTWRRSTPTAS